MYLLCLAGIIILVLVVLVICLDTIGETDLELAVFSLMAGIWLGMWLSVIWLVLGIIGCVFFVYMYYRESRYYIKERVENSYQNSSSYQNSTSGVYIPKLSQEQETVSVSKPTHTSPKNEIYYGPNGNQYEYIGGGIVIGPGGHVINGNYDGSGYIKTQQEELRKKML